MLYYYEEAQLPNIYDVYDQRRRVRIRLNGSKVFVDLCQIVLQENFQQLNLSKMLRYYSDSNLNV